MRELSVQLCFTWLSGPSKLDRNPSGAGSLWDLPNLSCSAWKFFLWTLWEKLMSALILAGGAKPATHYLHSHKPKCSMPFNVSLGLEPVTFSILPPASAANSPLLFKRVQCYKSSIWLSAGPSHDLVLNKSGHERLPSGSDASVSGMLLILRPRSQAEVGMDGPLITGAKMLLVPKCQTM